ncbi:phosphate ABC transporter substrate-binding protein [Streptomyces sp. CC77]|nr:phosphate ABC transporter substrate-binding protein [Streptomyces sp. CC77]
MLAASACGGGDAGSKGDGGEGGNKELSGKVLIDGSSTVAPLSSAASELYAEKQSKVQVTVATSGTGGGFKKFCVGETDISDASRPIKDEEIKTCEQNGIKYEQFAVANDALSVVVHKDNTWAKCLTVEQLKKMWEPGSKVNNWNQIDPSFPDEPLKLFGPGTDSGTFDYFTDEINGEEGASRTDYSGSEDDNVIVTGVSGTKGGLGYFGFSYYEENKDKLKVVDIDGGKGCVTPSVAATQDGTYAPLGRQLFIYPSDAGLKKPQVLDFVEFYVENHKKIAEDAQFIPLNAQQEKDLQAALDKLKAAAK